MIIRILGYIKAIRAGC